MLNSFTRETQLFITERQKLLNYLKNFKRYANNIVPCKDAEMKAYKNFSNFLEKFEVGSVKKDKDRASQIGDNKNQGMTTLISGDSE